MSYYYNFNFVSPEPVYATVREELKSYFDTGAIDDLMFPTYLDKCLKKLGRSTYVIAETPLYIEDFEARLPDNFVSPREVWMCAEIPLRSYLTPNAYYSQSASCTTIQLSPIITDGHCENPICSNDLCNGCAPETVQGVFKTNGEIDRAYVRTFMLQPGNIPVNRDCPSYNNNYHSMSMDSFDIRDNKIFTTFRKGTIHLIFYTEEYDEIGNQLIPDNFRIREYVEKFIKYKMFETLFNQINDETFNQIERKFMMYKQEADEAFIMATTEMKKETVWETQRKIQRGMNRFDKYRLPTYSRSRRR